MRCGDALENAEPAHPTAFVALGAEDLLAHMRDHDSSHSVGNGFLDFGGGNS
jgi:hypothetical protein